MGVSVDNTALKAQIAELIKRGLSGQALIDAIGGEKVYLISVVRKELGLSKVPDRRPGAVQERMARMRELAAQGYSTRQIATEIGLSLERVRHTVHREGIVVAADRVTAGTHRHDPTRIVEHIVMDAEHLTSDVDLIDWARLDRTRLPEWLGSLKRSRERLMAFIRVLMREQQLHGQAIDHTHPVQDPARADQPDAGAAGAGDAEEI